MTKAKWEDLFIHTYDLRPGDLVSLRYSLILGTKTKFHVPTAITTVFMIDHEGNIVEYVCNPLTLWQLKLRLIP
jgi:hypothetical protein